MLTVEAIAMSSWISYFRSLSLTCLGKRRSNEKGKEKKEKKRMGKIGDGVKKKRFVAQMDLNRSKNNAFNRER